MKLNMQIAIEYELEEDLDVENKIKTLYLTYRIRKVERVIIKKIEGEGVLELGFMDVFDKADFENLILEDLDYWTAGVK